MQDSVRETLAGLIKKYGTSLIYDPRRVEGLLRDLCGENKREINALVGTLKLKVPADLLNISNVPVEMLSARLIKRVDDDLGMKEELAQCAVESWAAALGIRFNALAPDGVRTGDHTNTELAFQPKPRMDDHQKSILPETKRNESFHEPAKFVEETIDNSQSSKEPVFKIIKNILWTALLSAFLIYLIVDQYLGGGFADTISAIVFTLFFGFFALGGLLGLVGSVRALIKWRKRSL